MEVEMFTKNSLVLLCLVAMVAAGCAKPTARNFGSDVVVAPDGTGRWTRGSLVQAEGSQIVRSADEKCDPVKDADGKTVGWTNCVEQAVHAASDDSPGAKTGKIAGGITEKAALAGGMVGAAALLKPAVTKVTQQGGGAIVGDTKATADAKVDPTITNTLTLENKPVTTNTNTPKVCSGTGCTNN